MPVNFDSIFSSVHENMGITEEFKGTVNIKSEWVKSNPNSLKKLNSDIGLDIKIKDIEISLDGFLLVYGQKVSVYIRDVYSKFELPKYHIVNCRTLISMREKNKEHRYVVTKNRSQNYILNIDGANCKKRLQICQNCLRELNINEDPKKFSLENYFNKNHSRIVHQPKNSPASAIVNHYSSNWAEISKNFKEYKKWICEECKKDFSSNRNSFDTHHINGIKNDNSMVNLKALCFDCHSNQPGHGHMKLEKYF